MNMKQFFNQFMLPIICGGVGLVIALLFIFFGFFKTLLILILTILGVFLGFYLEKNDLIARIFNSNRYY